MCFYSGEKPYVCVEDGCSKAYTSRYSLNSHKGNKHSNTGSGLANVSTKVCRK